MSRDASTADSGLEALGWPGPDGEFSRTLGAEGDEPSWFPARVTGEERGFYRVQVDPVRWHWAEIAGKLRHDAARRRDFAVVGDWVLCSGDLAREEARLTVNRVLPRRSLLSRKAAGEDESAREQTLAANVDVAFLMTSLNLDLNLRRLDRYLTLVYDGGATPVVLLTKSDLAPEGEAARRIAEIAARAPGVAAHAISVRTGDGLAALAPLLAPGRTVVLLGSSGVGKSTLANGLLGREALKTQEIREHDQRGRHTTTSRSLFLLESGAMLIDTPGMREIQMLDQGEGLAELYPDVSERILRCKFTDCRHASEPGCAIRAGLESGELPRERWEAYLKLEAEILARDRRADKAREAEPPRNHERSRARKLERQARTNVKTKRWDRT